MPAKQRQPAPERAAPADGSHAQGVERSTFNPLWAGLAWGVQAKGIVGAADDPLEREADAAAAHALGAADAAPGEFTRAPPAAPPPANTPPAVARALSAPGEPLAAPLRAHFEQRLGADLGSVRLHHGTAAQQAAASVGARAFALGRHIAFGADAYPLSGAAGMALLGHELAHTVQPGAHEVLRRDDGDAPNSTPAIPYTPAGPNSTPAPPSSTPASPDSSPAETPAGPAATPGSGTLRWNDILVSTDRSALRTQFEGVVEKGGLGALRRWAQGFLALDRNVLAPSTRALFDADFDAMSGAVNETWLQVETDAKGFVDALGPKAIAITNGILDASRERIEAELEHYGIKQTPVEPAGGGGAEGAPGAYETRVTMDNTAAGQNAQQRARGLAEARRANGRVGAPRLTQLPQGEIGHALTQRCCSSTRAGT